MSSADFTATIKRFTGFGAHYDDVRPSAPTALADLLGPIAGCRVPRLVVDLGCGTGLSTRYWCGRAELVIGVDPTESMLQQAQAMGGVNITYRQGFSHDTGLEPDTADLVLCAQSLHWMDPAATFAEAARILRPGGVFAAYDYDWPPASSSWEVDKAYTDSMNLARRLEREHGLTYELSQWEKSGHLARMEASACFRHVRECLRHHQDEGGAERITGLFLSQGYVQSLLKHNLSEKDIGVEHLRETAHRVWGSSRPLWFWSARVRMGIR